MKAPPLLALFALTAPLVAADPRGDSPDSAPSTPQEQLAMFHVPPGFEVQLVAAEPEIQKPLSLNFDAGGRLWATGTALYPWPAATDANGQPIPGFEKGWQEMAEAFRVGEAAPTPPPVGKDTLRILSDFGPDGHARKIVIFADGLNIPTGIQPLPRQPDAKGDRAIVFSIPNIWRMTDTDGDGSADLREPLYQGFGYTDTHGMSSNYLHWIDGWIYGCHGFKNHSEVKDRAGRVTVFDSGNTYRFRPDGSQIEYYTHGQTNPYGLTVDPLGNFFSADSHSKPVMLLIRGGYYAGIGKEHDGLGFAPTITDDDHGSSAIAGIAYYADDKFPEEYRGNLFNGNPVTRRINRDRLEWQGSTPQSIRMPDFLTCDDPWFRPVQVKLGPDGALWIADFYTPIIGHYEVPLTDPRRDQKHGRIWRIVWRGEAPGSAPVPGAGDGVPPTRTSEDDRNANTPSATEDAAKVRRSETPRPAPETGALPGSTAPPDLTQLDAAALVKKLGDPNLIVRTSATHELIERVGAEAIPRLRQLITPEEPNRGDGEEVPLRYREPATAEQRAHALIAFQRLAKPAIGNKGSALFNNRRFRGEDASRIFALQFTAEEHQWYDPDYECIAHALSTESPALVRRNAWALLSRASRGLIFGDHLVWLRHLDRNDPQLIYQAKVALREYFQGLNVLAVFGEEKLETDSDQAFICDVLLAVPTPEAAAFLLTQLQQTKLAAPRADAYLKHAALNLPKENFAALASLTTQVGDAPLNKRFALADALGTAARERKIALPEEAQLWTERVLVEALNAGKDKLLDDAIAAVREMKSESKRDALAKIVVSTKENGLRRAEALDALMNLPGAFGIASFALHDPSSLFLRKKAAEWLGQQCDTGVPPVIGRQDTDGDACATLLTALPTAPTELAIVIGVALAKTHAGCSQLLDLIEHGQAPATLLRSIFVAHHLAARDRTLRDRAAALTKDLPPEDARLAKVISERAKSFREAKPDTTRGAQVFQQHCAVCHRFRNAGGNVGPNLDGVSARGTQRVIEDILDPHRNVDPAFHQTTVETQDGQTFTGANVREGGDTLTLTDATGKDATFQKTNIESRTTAKFSLMPALFETLLPPADFHDLLAYLLGSTAQH